MKIETLYTIKSNLLSSLQVACNEQNWLTGAELMTSLAEVDSAINDRLNLDSFVTALSSSKPEVETENWRCFTQNSLTNGDKIKLFNGKVFTVTGGLDVHPEFKVVHCWHSEGSVAAAHIEYYFANQVFPRPTY